MYTSRIIVAALETMNAKKSTKKLDSHDLHWTASMAIRISWKPFVRDLRCVTNYARIILHPYLLVGPGANVKRHENDPILLKHHIEM